MNYSLRKNYLLDKSPADLIAWVATVGLANISLYTYDYLKHIGWYIELPNGIVFLNPVVKELYTFTNAGVWVDRKDASGYDIAPGIIQQNSTYSYKALANIMRPTISELYPTSSTTVVLKSKPRKHLVSFISNAGGTIDNDPELVPALAGYYGVIDEIVVISNGPNTPLFEIQEGSTGLGQKVSPGTLVAGKPQVMECLRYGSTDNSAISLDGSDCSDLGNAQNYDLEVHYHYET